MRFLEAAVTLASSTLLIAPPSAALLAGWTPHVVRHRPGPLKVLGTAGLFLYAAVAVTAGPRLLGAGSSVTNLAAYAALALTGAAVLLSIRYDLKSGPSTSIAR